MAIFHYRIKSGRNARRNARYIQRRGQFSSHGDVIHVGQGNLPAWAAGDWTLFWATAEKYERSNGAVYREHVVALPIELTHDQLIELAERLARELAGSKPYQYAIHMSQGNLGGVLNPHMHLMHSDRVQDGIDRPPAQMFSRFNPKHPELGGCRKDSGGKTPLELRDEVLRTRKTIAEIQNHALDTHGHNARIDHRSLREQGRRRRPERHLGPAFVRSMGSNEKALYNTMRRASSSG